MLRSRLSWPVLVLMLAGSALAASGAPPAASAQATPITGIPVPELAALDRVMLEMLATWRLPGGQLAVGKDGRLVLSRAYGLADVAANEAAQPESLFRIASVTKPITGVAILKLVDEGKLRLDDQAFRILDHLQPPHNASVDPRLGAITIEHLLMHAGGWSAAASFDPQYPPFTWWAAGVLGESAPPSGEEIIRFMLGQPLDFDPGTKYAYSNFGYNVLGRVIETVSGLPYEEYVRTQVLAPAGITDMRLGRTRPEQRAPREVRYYAPPGQPLQRSVFPGQGYVPFADGGFYLEAFDAHGGWIATASDLVRFAMAVDGQRGPALLRPETVRRMERTARPEAAGAAGAGNEATAYGLAWVVQAAGGGCDWSHAGALEGSNAAWLMRTHDGLTVAFVVNSLPERFDEFFGQIIPSLTRTLGDVRAWPTHDLFITK